MNTPRDYAIAIANLPVSRILLVQVNETTTALNNPSFGSIRNYASQVKNLQAELDSIRRLLVEFTRRPIDNDEIDLHARKCLNCVFRGLLAEKARQEAIQKMRNYNSSSAQDSGASPADDTSGSIRIRNILQQKIARCA